MKRLACLLLILALTLPAAAQPHYPSADSTDVSSPDAIIGALYDVISGPQGEPRDWDRFRSLFAPGARLIPITRPDSGTAQASALSVEDFVQQAQANLAENGFFEQEVHRRTQRFGGVLHAMSTYESRRVQGGEPFDRGVNSIQLFHDGERWWVVTIFWDRERPGHPIPPELLPNGDD